MLPVPTNSTPPAGRQKGRWEWPQTTTSARASPASSSRRAAGVWSVSDSLSEAGLPCVPHSANRSMVTVFTLHMLAAIPNAGPHLEFSIEPSKWTGELFSPQLEAEDGNVAIPAGPGWGVEINQEWLEKAEYQISEKT